MNVTPGGSYAVPSDGVYVLTSLSKGPANAWWLMDGIEFFGVNNGEACIPLWLKKGTKLTTRSGEGFSYVVRCVFQHSLSQCVTTRNEGEVISIGTSSFKERVISFGEVALIVDDNGIRIWDYSVQDNTHRVRWDWQYSLSRVVRVEEDLTGSSCFYNRGNNALCIAFTGEITASSGKTYSIVQLLANGAGFHCMGLNSQNGQWEPFLQRQLQLSLSQIILDPGKVSGVSFWGSSAVYCGITISFADGTLGVLTMDGGGGIKYRAAQYSLSQYKLLPKMFFAMTASKNALYITVPAPSFAKGAMVGGSAVIMLRSSFDELTTFTPHGAMISGGTLLIEGVINPEAHSSNTCYAGWFEKCDLDVSWE